MTRKSLVLAAAVALVAVGSPAAQVSGTITLVSDYDFRGITLSAGDPALQASIDWSGPGGLELGAWASNVDFGGCCDESVEVDLYGSWTFGDSESGVALDAFGIWYAFPGGNDLDYPELSLGLAHRCFEGRVWATWDYGGSGRSATYIEANANVPLPARIDLALHVGYSYGDYWTEEVSGLDDYVDWSVGVQRSFGQFDTALRWVDGSDLRVADGTPGDVLSSAPRFILSVGTTLPWRR